MQAAKLQKLLDRNAVMLALFTLTSESDPGVIFDVRAKDISPLARRSVRVIKRTLAEMERTGEIVRFGHLDLCSIEIIVLVGEPGAKEFIAEFRGAACA